NSVEFEQTDINLSGLLDNPDQQNHLLSIYREKLTQIVSDGILKRLDLLNNIGSLYSRQENYSMAMKCFDEAVKLFIQNKKSDRFFSQQFESSMIRIYFGISRVYYRQENWPMSLNNLERVLEFAVNQNQEHPMLAEIYHSMGLSYAHKLDISMAIHYLELAISTAKKTLPDDHPRVKLYFHHLRQLKPSM
ncbi:unnamed protein product, partial [Rotaria sp. Silwood1]